MRPAGFLDNFGIKRERAAEGRSWSDSNGGFRSSGYLIEVLILRESSKLSYSQTDGSGCRAVLASRPELPNASPTKPEEDLVDIYKIRFSTMPLQIPLSAPATAAFWAHGTVRTSGAFLSPRGSILAMSSAESFVGLGQRSKHPHTGA